jgi:hypothetical protein
MDKKRETKQEVIKHSAAIQIQNSITLLQRRAWNVLLANAYDGLSDEEEHSIRIQLLMQTLEFHSKNEDYLKEALEALVGCTVQWNVLNKDGEFVWGVTTLLAQAKIERGLCTYAYSPEMRRRLHNPSMYARLSLSMQNKFESKHAQALWELSADYLGAGREEGATPLIPLEVFRNLMGIPEGMYPEFMRLNEKVIKPAIAEINRVSDFRVTVDYHRQGRKVIALQFKIRRIILLPTPNNGQGKLFPDVEDMPIIVKELKEAGIAARDAWEIYQQGFGYVQEDERPIHLGENEEVAFVEYVREKIHLLKRRLANSKVENSTGFLLQAIRQNYANPEFAQELRREASAARQQAKREIQKQLKMLEQQKADLEKARDRELNQLRDQIAAESPDVLDQAVAELLAKDKGFLFLYKRDKSALENYQSRPSLQAFFNPYLEKLDPARFETIRQRYAAQTAAVNAQIAALDD